MECFRHTWPDLPDIADTLLNDCFLHLDILSWSGLHTSVVVARRKLFRDFSRAAGAWWLNIGCRGSFICLVLSMSALTSRLLGGGAVPAKR